MPETRGDDVAVLLMNYGGPEGPEDCEPYLRNIFLDPDLIPIPGLHKTRRGPVCGQAQGATTTAELRSHGTLHAHAPGDDGPGPGAGSRARSEVPLLRRHEVLETVHPRDVRCHQERGLQADRPSPHVSARIQDYDRFFHSGSQAISQGPEMVRGGGRNQVLLVLTRLPGRHGRRTVPGGSGCPGRNARPLYGARLARERGPEGPLSRPGGADRPGGLRQGRVGVRRDRHPGDRGGRFSRRRADRRGRRFARFARVAEQGGTHAMARAFRRDRSGMRGRTRTSSGS